MPRSKVRRLAANKHAQTSSTQRSSIFTTPLTVGSSKSRDGYKTADTAISASVFDKYIQVARQLTNPISPEVIDRSEHELLQWVQDENLSPYERHSALLIYLWDQYENIGRCTVLDDVLCIGKVIQSLAQESGIQPPELAAQLSLLANAYSIRFKLQQEPDDLDNAIATFQECFLLQERWDTEFEFLATAEMSMCTVLQWRFGRTKQHDDITEAIAYGRSAVKRTAKNDARYPTLLCNVATAVHARFSHFEIEQDLESCIDLGSEALKAGEMAQWDAKALALLQHNLGTMLLSQTRQVDASFRTPESLGDVASECISLLIKAIAGNPHSIDLPYSQHSLANAYAERFLIRKDVKDINAAIEIQDIILNDRITQSRWRAEAMLSLSFYYQCRYETSKDPSDITKAMGFGQKVLDDDIDEDKTLYVYSMFQSCYKDIYDLNHDSRDLEESYKYALKIISHPHSTVDDRVGHSLALAQTLHAGDEYALSMQVYRQALTLLPQVLLLGRRYRTGHLMSAGLVFWDELTTGSAACAISSGDPSSAVEMLETGRSIGWRQNLQLRHESEKLAIDHQEYAQKLTNLSRELEKASFKHVVSEAGALKDYDGFGVDPWEECFNLTQQREALLSEIRTFEGYHDFLLPLQYEKLRVSAEQGPVVIINVYNQRSDALIVTHATLDRPQIVPLSTSLQDLVKEWSDTLRDATEKLERGDISERDFDQKVLRPILRGLWDDIVYPIREVLRVLDPYAHRIWWCPTKGLTFLPLHFVTNGLPRTRVADTLFRLTPSYATTLSALLHSKKSSIQPEDTKVLLVNCSDSEGFDKIEGSKDEVIALEEMLRGQDVNSLKDSDATAEKVLGCLAHYNWLHIASHGVQAYDEPYRSYFQLRDGPLYLSDIVAKQSDSLSQPRLAFLSACHTAKGVPRLSDEAMHLASALHFLGFRGTIATMWAANDETTPDLVKEVYSYICRRGSKRHSLDGGDAAEGLARAIRILLKKGVSLSRLAQFIHIGA